jgi:hypothetical protein
MNRDDITRIALKAGFDWSGNELSWESVICTEELECFAAFVAAAEREACAELIESHGTWVMTETVVAAIRARGQE